mgnify:CR=1 FL=1
MIKSRENEIRIAKSIVALLNNLDDVKFNPKTGNFFAGNTKIASFGYDNKGNRIIIDRKGDKLCNWRY